MIANNHFFRARFIINVWLYFLVTLVNLERIHFFINYQKKEGNFLWTEYILVSDIPKMTKANNLANKLDLSVSFTDRKSVV